jgi:hypothetical protein
MPRITNLFKEKAYVFSSEPKVYDSEKDLINKIFSDNGLPNPKKIQFLDANINNDLFLVENSVGKFCVKLSLDNQNKFLNKEFEVLLSNFDKKIMMYPLMCGNIKDYENVEYSITGYAPIPNIGDAGIANSLNNESLPMFFENLNSFRMVKNLPSQQDYLDKYLSFDLLKVPDFNPAWIEKHGEIKKLVSDQVLFLQSLLKNNQSVINGPEKKICHGNLNKSTILVFGEYLHAINWENAYVGNILFEMALLRFELFYDSKFENYLFSSFESKTNTQINQAKLKDYKTFASYFSLLKIMVDYLTEVYMLRCNRENKILDCAIKFSKNYDTFYQLPDFDKKLKPIAEFFVESVI